MHELPGMTPQCINLATRVVDAGFTVFLPLLDRDATVCLISVCVSHKFSRTRNQPDHLLAKGVEQKDSR